jgi:hypothetical protein
MIHAEKLANQLLGIPPNFRFILAHFSKEDATKAKAAEWVAMMVQFEINVEEASMTDVEEIVGMGNTPVEAIIKLWQKMNSTYLPNPSEN